MKYLKDVMSLKKAVFLDIEDYFYILPENGVFTSDLIEVFGTAYTEDADIAEDYIILNGEKLFFNPSEIEDHIVHETWEDARCYWEVWNEDYFK